MKFPIYGKIKVMFQTTNQQGIVFGWYRPPPWGNGWMFWHLHIYFIVAGPFKSPSFERTVSQKGAICWESSWGKIQLHGYVYKIIWYYMYIHTLHTSSGRFCKQLFFNLREKLFKPSYGQPNIVTLQHWKGLINYIVWSFLVNSERIPKWLLNGVHYRHLLLVTWSGYLPIHPGWTWLNLLDWMCESFWSG